MCAIINKSILLEHNTDPEIFRDMDKFEIDEAKKFSLSVKLQFPKFSKGFSSSDFTSFIQEHVGDENLVSLGRLNFPNEWQMQVRSNDIRERLIREGRYKINMRSCWVSPLSQSEVRGYVHWIPNAISEETIRGILESYGKVVFIEVQQSDTKKWTKVDCDTRYFALNLKAGQTKDDVPHFFKINEHHGLITIRGRAPSCFHCKTIGHRKAECKKYREKLNSYCKRTPGSGVKRTKPRGQRHRPSLNPENQGAAVTKRKKKKKKAKAAGDPKISNEAVKTEDVVSGAAKLQEVVETLSKIDLRALQGLSNLSSALSSISSSLNQLQQPREEMQAPNTEAASKGEEKAPQESGDKAAEGEIKKKKKKKKKKKAASEVSDESVPPNN